MTELLDLVGLPKTLQNSLLNHLASEFGLNTYSQGTARDGGHGCNNDGFAVFGFLAFLLALLDLILELNMNKKRRRRFAMNDGHSTNEIIKDWQTNTNQSDVRDESYFSEVAWNRMQTFNK